MMLITKSVLDKWICQITTIVSPSFIRYCQLGNTILFLCLFFLSLKYKFLYVFTYVYTHIYIATSLHIYTYPFTFWHIYLYMKSMLVKTLLNFQVATVNSQIEIFIYQSTDICWHITFYVLHYFNPLSASVALI